MGNGVSVGRSLVVTFYLSPEISVFFHLGHENFYDLFILFTIVLSFERKFEKFFVEDLLDMKV